MKVIIVGPGALGTLIAAFLSRARAEVWLLDKNKERSRLLAEKGISVEGVSGSWQARVRASTSAEEIGPADLVIVCVKSYDTKEAVMRVKPAVAAHTMVLSLQNGIGNIEIIGEIVGSDKVLGGSTNMGATLESYGCVRHAGKGETVIGRMDGRIPVEIRSVREIFQKAGLEIRISRDIKGVLWSKLIINVGINAISALVRLANGRLTEFEGTRRVLREAVSEATRVAKRKKIKLMYDDPLAKVEAVCEATSQNISSMLQDVLNKKRTEIDFINGVVVRQGQELNIPTPVNSLLVDLVKTLESSYRVTEEKNG